VRAAGGAGETSHAADQGAPSLCGKPACFRRRRNGAPKGGYGMRVDSGRSGGAEHTRAAADAGGTSHTAELAQEAVAGSRRRTPRRARRAAGHVRTSVLPTPPPRRLRRLRSCARGCAISGARAAQRLSVTLREPAARSREPRACRTSAHARQAGVRPVPPARSAEPLQFPICERCRATGRTLSLFRDVQRPKGLSRR